MKDVNLRWGLQSFADEGAGNPLGVDIIAEEPAAGDTYLPRGCVEDRKAFAARFPVITEETVPFKPPDPIQETKHGSSRK